jgi:hypothetical protein
MPRTNEFLDSNIYTVSTGITSVAAGTDGSRIRQLLGVLNVVAWLTGFLMNL